MTYKPAKTTKSTALKPYSPAERRAVLAEAREQGAISYDRLDRLLVESARTPPKLRGLLRSLEGVKVVPSALPDDVLAGDAELDSVLDASLTGDLFQRYADRVRMVPRMTRSEEHLLARRLEFARERLRQAIDRANLQLDEETRDTMLMRGVQCDDFGADAAEGRVSCGDLNEAILEAGAVYNHLREHFVKRNLYLVIGMSAAYRTYGIPMMDLIQEGNTSLIRAVEKFDWRKDVRFQTYAAFWVRQAVERMITANRGIVRVPNYLQQKMRRLRREGKLPRNHREMDMREVSKHFETNMTTAIRLMETDRGCASLDSTFRDEDGNTLGSTLEAEVEDRGLPDAEQELLGNRLGDVMSENLTEQEQDILVLRFGLDGEPPRTLDQIGERMSVSRERIRQMQVKALDKLQKPRLLEALKDFL